MLKHTGNVIKVFMLSQGDISAGKAELLKPESLNTGTKSTHTHLKTNKII